VRGILCNRCNAALGMMRDNTQALARAIEYLREYELRFALAAEIGNPNPNRKLY
jgi:hypothetical protein